MKIIVSAGGTGGHIYPALAIVDEFKKHHKDLEVLYIGTFNRMEKDIVKDLGIKFVGLEIYGLSKTNMVRNVKNVFLIKKCIKQCEDIIDDFKPDIVIGTGGYVVYPVVKAAANKNVKIFIHEQNSIPGKSNKALSKYADLIGVSFSNSIKYFNEHKNIFYSGNPCGSSALNAEDITKKKLGFDNKKLVLIVSGSLGSESINNVFKKYLKFAGGSDYNVIYVTGNRYYDDFIKNEDFESNIKVVPYLDNLTSVLKLCDLIVTRAGASTISEILALKKKSILVPSPYVANNHQYHNAKDLVDMGVSILLEEKNLTVEMISNNINSCLFDEVVYSKLDNSLNKLGLEDSSNLIYTKIKELIDEGNKKL